MIQLAKEHNDIKFIFMHNLGIPSDKKITVNGNIIDEIKKWLENKIEIFEKNNLNKNNLIFDVGIGFGKTPSQDLQLLQNLSEFHQYGFKILVGHSRKSFIKVFNNDEKAINRDIESIAISMQIAQNVDIIRTHAPLEHQRALIAKDHCYNQFV